MADAALHGNGTKCPACTEARGHYHDPSCAKCKGTGRVARTRRAIVAESVSWARKNYWPEQADEEHRPRAGS